jgi:hypothetical protein
MLDPITALGVAGSLIQFIDFGLKATSKAREIHKSATGALSDNIDIEILTDDLAKVVTKLEVSSGRTTGNDGLNDICKRCTTAANHLMDALRSMKVEGDKSNIKSTRKALKAMWGKKGVEELKNRLEGFRDEMQFHVLVDLKYVPYQHVLSLRC